MPKFQVGDLVVKRDDKARGRIAATDPTDPGRCQVRWSDSGALWLGSEDELDALELEDEAGSLD
jgi:hypothetical protein